MSTPLLELVPNFSEGKDQALVDGIVAEMTAVAGVACLSAEFDGSHHRAVVTLAGPAGAVAEAAFVGATMGDAVQTARAVGKRIGEELELPVFLYAEACRREERRKLGNIRNKQFEALRDLVGSDDASDDDYTPDFGPARMHESAGAVGVGAHKFLIAYNINLKTEDVAVAKGVESELVGLAPAAAIDEQLAAHIKLPTFDANQQVVEKKLQAGS